MTKLINTDHKIDIEYIEARGYKVDFSEKVCNNWSLLDTEYWAHLDEVLDYYGI